MRQYFKHFFWAQAITLVMCLAVYVASACAQPSSSNDSTKTQYGNIAFQLNQNTSFYLVVDENFDAPHHMTNLDEVRVKAGAHSFRLVKKYYRDRYFTATVKPGKSNLYVTSISPIKKIEKHKILSSYPRLHWQANIVIQTDSAASIYVDNDSLGRGIAKFDSTGIFNVTSRHPSGGVLTRQINTNEWGQPFKVISLYHRPIKLKAKLLSFVPGGSQLYQREYLKAGALMGGIAVGLLLSVSTQSRYNDAYNQYLRDREIYENTRNPGQALTKGNEIERLYHRADRLNNTRNRLVLATLGLYVYNVIDGLLSPRLGYRSKSNFDPYIDFEEGRLSSAGLTWKYKLNAR